MSLSKVALLAPVHILTLVVANSLLYILAHLLGHCLTLLHFNVVANISGDLLADIILNLFWDLLAHLLRHLLALLFRYLGAHLPWHIQALLARYTYTHGAAYLSWYIPALLGLYILANIPLDSLALLLRHNNLYIGTLGLWYISTLLLSNLLWHLSGYLPRYINTLLSYCLLTLLLVLSVIVFLCDPAALLHRHLLALLSWHNLLHGMALLAGNGLANILGHS